MPSTPPVWLSIRTREYLDPADEDERQVVEVLQGDKVLGQLPVSRVVYEMLPNHLGTVRIDLHVERGQIETVEMERKPWASSSPSTQESA